MRPATTALRGLPPIDNFKVLLCKETFLYARVVFVLCLPFFAVNKLFYSLSCTIILHCKTWHVCNIYTYTCNYYPIKIDLVANECPQM